ncbi:MAG TPA: hypothetical protein VF933_37950 [Streptosporangiaceae bacterium]
MHKTSGLRDPAASFPLPGTRDDHEDRRQANRAVAGSVPGVMHAHARARWTGRTLRVGIEGWVGPDLSVGEAVDLGRQVAAALASEVPEAGSLTWTARALPGVGST